MYVLLDGVEINAKVILLKAIILSSDFDCPDYNNYILELLNFSDFTFALLMLKFFFKNNKSYAFNCVDCLEREVDCKCPG